MVYFVIMAIFYNVACFVNYTNTTHKLQHSGHNKPEVRFMSINRNNYSHENHSGEKTASNAENYINANNLQSASGIASDGTKVYLGSKSLTWDAKQRRDAIAKGIVKPAMAYSQQELTTNEDTGVWASQSTVDSQVKLREETPRG